MMNSRSAIHDLLVIAGVVVTFRFVNPYLHHVLLYVWLPYCQHALLCAPYLAGLAGLSFLMGYAGRTFVTTRNTVLIAVCLAVAAVVQPYLLTNVYLHWYYRIYVMVVVAACVTGALFRHRRESGKQRASEHHPGGYAEKPQAAPRQPSG